MRYRKAFNFDIMGKIRVVSYPKIYICFSNPTRENPKPIYLSGGKRGRLFGFCGR